MEDLKLKIENVKCKMENVKCKVMITLYPFSSGRIGFPPRGNGRRGSSGGREEGLYSIYTPLLIAFAILLEKQSGMKARMISARMCSCTTDSGKVLKMQSS